VKWCFRHQLVVDAPVLWMAAMLRGVRRPWRHSDSDAFLRIGLDGVRAGRIQRPPDLILTV